MFFFGIFLWVCVCFFCAHLFFVQVQRFMVSVKMFEHLEWECQTESVQVWKAPKILEPNIHAICKNLHGLGHTNTGSRQHELVFFAQVHYCVMITQRTNYINGHVTQSLGKILEYFTRRYEKANKRTHWDNIICIEYTTENATDVEKSYVK